MKPPSELCRILLASLIVAGTAAAQNRPNVVFLFADDLGWTDVSTGATNAGHPSDYYRTPRIAALASAGMSFDNAYSCGPNCAPTRAALMSGQYGPRTGIYTVGNSNRGQSKFRKVDGVKNKTRLESSVITLAETLQRSGYATGHFGKWHLGNDGDGQGPLSQGFDVNVAGTQAGSVSGGSKGHFAKPDGSFRLPGMKGNGRARDYMADRLTDEALKFMAEKKDRAFFVYLTHFSVHTPIQAPAADIAAFDEIEKGKRHKNQTYAGMLRNLDENIGRIVDYLERTPDPRAKGEKLIANTMVIFYSDNGGLGGYRDAGVTGGKEVTHQYPLKSGKGSLYEGGIRVPLIVRFDGRVKAGTVSHVPVISVDFHPTLAAVASAALPKDQVLDGESFLPVLTGKSSGLDRTSLYWHFPAYLQASGRRGSWRTTPCSVVRRGDWKLHYYYETARFELYNLKDIGESDDRAGEKPDLVKTLGAELKKWLIDTKADLPLRRGTKQALPYPGDANE